MNNKQKISKRLNPNLWINSLILLLLLFSCETETVKNRLNDGINNFKALSEQFAEPSKEYGTAPLYVWNTKITPELLDRTMTDLKDKGFGGVFVHPRPGLVTEYLSDEWYDLFRHAINKGKELDMNVWIYDENSYPSGFAGGHVPAAMPESYNQGQSLIFNQFTTFPDTIPPLFICLKKENDKVTDITGSMKDELGKQGDYYGLTKGYYGKSPWYGGYSYVDLLYPGVTEKFIEITMDGYKKHLGDEFGKTIPGWFTDEPNINPPGGIKWTPDLFDVFKNKWGYDLKDCLLSLYEETGEWKTVRHNYMQLLLQLFIDRWAKPGYEYCEKNNLKFTGHYWEHGWPSMADGPDNMAMYAWHQMPAIDMLFNQFNEESPQAQFGNVRSVKELGSVANQMGYKRTLSETYGGGGWEETFRDFKRLGDWEYVLGVNFMNQHLSHLSISGARKYDYPPTFSEHSPWWKYYKTLNMHYARLSLALSAGEQLNDVLIIEPTTSIWMYYAFGKSNQKYRETGDIFQKFVTSLEKEQLEYDLGSENIIKDQGSVKKNKFVVGQRSYSKVIIPPAVENLDSATFRLLQKFYDNGGAIFTFSQPSYLDGSLNEEVKTFFAGDKIISLESALLENPKALAEKFASSGIQFNPVRTGDDNGNLLHHRRILGDGQVLFLANVSLTGYAKGAIKTKGKDAVEMNTLTGIITDYNETENNSEINIDYNIPPAGSLLLYIFDKKQTGFEKYPEPKTYSTVTAENPLTIKPEEDNVLTVDFCDLQIGNESFADLHTYNAADKVYRYHGFNDGNPWNTSVQYKDNIVRRDTFGSGGFKATYKFKIEGDFDMSAMKAAIERPHLYRVSLNGNEIKAQEGKYWLDPDIGVFLIGKYAKKGENLLSLELSPMKIHAELEPVYILGDFTVAPASKGWTLNAPNTQFTLGSWKEQGWRFYSGTVSYTKNISIAEPASAYRVRLNQWNGTVSEVKVNGKSAGIIAFAPYAVDVSGLIQKGDNVIEVKIVGSNKNLLGPFHRNPGPGLVSPWHFRGVTSYPSGNEYQQLDYGLMDDFVLEKNE